MPKARYDPFALLKLIEKPVRQILALAPVGQLQEIDEDVEDHGHGVALVDPALGLQAAADAHVVADVELAGVPWRFPNRGRPGRSSPALQ